MANEAKPPFPPLALDTAKQDIRAAEYDWNSRDPERVTLAYTVHSEWRNRSEFLKGHKQIIAFLRRKWARERDYRLKKELWRFAGDRIAVRLEYEYDYDTGQRYRAYGNENGEFAGNGLMQRPYASISYLPIAGFERKLRRERRA